MPLPSPVGPRLARLAELLREACGCGQARPCARCSLRALDRAAGTAEGHAAAIIGGTYATVEHATVTKYAHALGVREEWLLCGSGNVLTEDASLPAPRDLDDPADASVIGVALLTALLTATAARKTSPAPSTPDPAANPLDARPVQPRGARRKSAKTPASVVRS